MGVGAARAIMGQVEQIGGLGRLGRLRGLGRVGRVGRVGQAIVRRLYFGNLLLIVR